MSVSGFLVGDKISWVDLLIADHVADMTNRVPEFVEGFPEVSGRVQTSNSHPHLSIGLWIDLHLGLCDIEPLFLERSAMKCRVVRLARNLSSKFCYRMTTVDDVQAILSLLL